MVRGDSGTCMIVDLDVLGPESRLRLSPLRAGHTRRSSSRRRVSNLVLCGTGADSALPLEVSRLGPSAARICFTDDVDELAGRWAPVGELTLPSAACTAGAPFCRGETYRVVFDLLPGRFPAEIFRPGQPKWEVPPIACRGSRKRFASLRGSVLMGWVAG